MIIIIIIISFLFLSRNLPLLFKRLIKCSIHKIRIIFYNFFVFCYYFLPNHFVWIGHLDLQKKKKFKTFRQTKQHIFYATIKTSHGKYIKWKPYYISFNGVLAVICCCGCCYCYYCYRCFMLLLISFFDTS